ncbi:MAG: DUF4290 domain-containing protein [Cytophagales bacterium]|nr:DUF4290 domain-containing protein [Cytophagales bacterium]
MHEYNANRNPLILKEYGRNIQKLVEHVCTIKDKETRTKYAHALLELIMRLTPHIKNAVEYSRKFWDDMFIMSGYSLDVESPYPMPEENLLAKKPPRLAYKTQPIKLKHYGRNVELLIEKAITLESQEQQEQVISNVVKLIKMLNSGWNNDNTDEDRIIENIKKIARDKLLVDFEKLKAQSILDSPRERGRNNKTSRRITIPQRRKS